MKSSKLFWLILCLWIPWVTYWAWVLPYNMAPDECLHFKTAQFFQTHQGFPIAGKDEITFIREPGCVGTTYISTPFLNYFIAGHFINLGNRLSIERDYLAARMSSVFFGLIFVFFFYLLLRKMFEKNILLVFAILISVIFIPQVTYIFSYLNHEAYSLASSAFLLFMTFSFYKLSEEELNQAKNFLLLGLAISLQLFAKVNFYLLLLIPIMILVLKLWKERKIFLKNLILLMGVILLLSGWFFARNYIFYKDFFGAKTQQLIYRSNLGTPNPADLGWNAYDIFFKTSWLEETASSFYGRFGYMTIKIDPVMQWIFRGFVFLGIVGLIKKLTDAKKINLLAGDNLFYLLFSILIPLNMVISLLNSLYFDFQNQGRYLFPILTPLMILVNFGLFGLVKEKDSQKTLTIAIIAGSLLLNFWSFLYLPKI